MGHTATYKEYVLQRLGRSRWLFLLGHNLLVDWMKQRAGDAIVMATEGGRSNESSNLPPRIHYL